MVELAERHRFLGEDGQPLGRHVGKAAAHEIDRGRPAILADGDEAGRIVVMKGAWSFMTVK